MMDYMDLDPFFSNIPFPDSSFTAYSIELDNGLDRAKYTATYVAETTWNGRELSNDLESAQSLFGDQGGVDLFGIELDNRLDGTSYTATYVTETRWNNKELSNDLQSAQNLLDNQGGVNLFSVVDNRYNRNNDENHGTMKDFSDVINESDDLLFDLFETDQYEHRVVCPENEENTSSVELGNFKTSDLPGKEKTASNSKSDVSGKIRKSSKSRRNRTSTNIIKWVYDLLCKGDPCIRWVNRHELKLLIVDQHRLARLWGIHKGNTKMNYNKFARTMRYHYERSKHKELVDISKKCKHKKKLVYHISPNAPFLQDDEPKHYN